MMNTIVIAALLAIFYSLSNEAPLSSEWDTNGRK